MLHVSCWVLLSISRDSARKDKTWSAAEMSVARRRPWSVVVDCSTPALQPQETRGSRSPKVDRRVGWQHQHRRRVHRASTATSSNLYLSAAGCRPDTPVLCRAQWYARAHSRNWMRLSLSSAIANHDDDDDDDDDAHTAPLRSRSFNNIHR